MPCLSKRGKVYIQVSSARRQTLPLYKQSEDSLQETQTSHNVKPPNWYISKENKSCRFDPPSLDSLLAQCELFFSWDIQ